MAPTNERGSSQRQNSEQQRGREAYKAVQAIITLDSSNKEKKLEKEYRSLARGLNAMIQINGLGQTLGFFKAKGKGDVKKSHYQLLLHLTNWMKEPEHFKAANNDVMEQGFDGLLRWIIDADTSNDDYRRATAECLAFGVWLRRFAEADLQEPDSGENIE